MVDQTGPTFSTSFLASKAIRPGVVMAIDRGESHTADLPLDHAMDQLRNPLIAAHIMKRFRTLVFNDKDFDRYVKKAEGFPFTTHEHGHA